jgi:hypothetical protein
MRYTPGRQKRDAYQENRVETLPVATFPEGGHLCTPLYLLSISSSLVKLYDILQYKF